MMFSQVGIKFNNLIEDITDMTEADLEDYILIKALIDFNSSKFSSYQETTIDAIIRDVFIDKLQDWHITSDLKQLVEANSQRVDYGNLK